MTYAYDCDRVWREPRRRRSLRLPVMTRADRISARPVREYSCTPKGEAVRLANVQAPALAAAINDNMATWFSRLATKWKSDTSGLSSITMKTEHPAFRAILQLGPKDEVVRLILRDLKREPAHWYPALKRLTGESPVPAQHRGKVAEMRRAWLDWGYRKGYIT
jgi:hypothetical protein